MSSSSSTAAAPSVLIPIAEKLHRSNFNVWRAQAMATIRGAQLVTYLYPKREVSAPKVSDKDGKVTDVLNPTYDIDRARNSQVLSFLFNSISPPCDGSDHNMQHGVSSMDCNHGDLHLPDAGGHRQYEERPLHHQEGELHHR